MIKNKNTVILISVLALLIVVLICLLVAVIGNFVSPASSNAQYVELPIYENMPLSQAKATLNELGISYEIKPTDSRVANRVEKFEYDGKEENGRTLAKVGSTVTLHSNEVGIDKVVYLTFDDGPIVNYNDSAMTDIYHTTRDILDTLDGYGIKATFFMVGYQMIKSDRSQYVTETLDRGHLIACHSSTHELNQIYSSSSKFVADIEQFENQLKNILGEERYNSLGKYLRFPGGTSTNGLLSKSEAKEYISKIREMGYKVYDWTASTDDAAGSSTTSQFISSMDTGLSKAKQSGAPLIILMHDKYTTSQSLPAIIDHLISNGYYFDTVDNCPEYTSAEN